MEEFNPLFNPLLPEEPEEPEKVEEEVSEGPTLTYDETPEEIQNRLRAQRQRPGRFAPEGELPPNAEPATPPTVQRQQQPPPPPEPEGRRRRGGRRIASVYFLDAEHAWAVGSGGSIYHTTDGGQTWERQLGEQQRNDFREVLFYDGQKRLDSRGRRRATGDPRRWADVGDASKSNPSTAHWRTLCESRT